jgi:short subunit dehydrogenase-like uncharacterized protein
MQRQYDVIVLGASGFTGKLVAEYMHGQYGTGNLRWALAGRNLRKLEAVRDEYASSDVDILVADSNDLDSLEALVQQGRVVLTTVGPYARYGSKLVDACAKHGTHYCDLTGEVHWMRKMIEAHQPAAEASGARIVHTCGFDSIPSDIGVYFLQKHMQERHGCPASHIKYRTRKFKGGASGGTIDSMMAMMEEAQSDPSIRRTVADPYALNFGERGLDGTDSVQPYYDADFHAWVGPFVMAMINTRVVRRSNELLGYAYGHDFRYDEGTLTGDGVVGMMGATATAMGTGLVEGLSALEPARSLMKRVLPKPGEGPSRETIETGYFEVELLAKHPEDSAKNLRALVRGDRDPGYGSTAKMIAESAVSLAQDEIDVPGGFWTPASAMGDALLDRLPAHAGVTFDLID